MWGLGGVVAAVIMAGSSWVLVGAGTRNLPASNGRLVLGVVLGVAAIIGFLAGAAVCRRAVRSRVRLVRFSGVAGGIAGGTIGCVYAVGLTASYLASYSSWPQGLLDQAFVVLAFPIFGALGFCLGALVGLAVGLSAGGILRLATVAR